MLIPVIITWWLTSFLGDVWKKHSKLVKDFISALMEFSPEKRLTAKEALEHKWIKECANMENVDIAVTAEAFKNLSKFRVIIRKNNLPCSQSKSYSKPH
jgi:serine/threonine protein kinase